MSTSSRKASAPSYRHHKPSGQAFVQFKKRRIYLGKHGTEASREAYARFIAEHWAPPDAPPPPITVRKDLTVLELIDRFWMHAHEHYRDKRGEPTGTAENLRPSLRRLKELYGSTLAASLGPLALKALRQTWIKDGLAWKTVNTYAATIKAVFKWGVSEELVPPTVHHALATVRGLARGRSQARETEPIGPVADTVVDATLPHLPAIVADMVGFQRLTGCRPGEVRLLRPRDVERFERSERPLPLFSPADRELRRRISATMR